MVMSISKPKRIKREGTSYNHSTNAIVKYPDNIKQNKLNDLQKYDIVGVNLVNETQKAPIASVKSDSKKAYAYIVGEFKKDLQ